MIDFYSVRVIFFFVFENKLIVVVSLDTRL